MIICLQYSDCLNVAKEIQKMLLSYFNFRDFPTGTEELSCQNPPISRKTEPAIPAWQGHENRPHFSRLSSTGLRETVTV